MINRGKSLYIIILFKIFYLIVSMKYEKRLLEIISGTLHCCNKEVEKHDFAWLYYESIDTIVGSVLCNKYRSIYTL